jgi:PII interaction protein X
MSSEIYLNHPNFGLLYRICLIEPQKELFTTLYAQRVFFLVNNGTEGIIFQPITRADARLMVDNRLRILRRDGELSEYQRLQSTYKLTFT